MARRREHFRVPACQPLPLSLTLSRITRRRNQRLLAFITALLLTTAFSFSRTVPLRLEADAAGIVRLRGPGVQGVDWHAAGRSSVTVPLLIYNAPTDGVNLTVDRRPLRVSVADIVTPDSATPPGPLFDDDAYQLAALWRPGRGDAVRQWTLTAVLVFVLVLAVARYADPKRATLWTIIAAAGLAGGAVAWFPEDSPRRELRAEGRPGWDCIWRAEDGVAEEPWTPGLRFLPRSTEQLAAAEPVLTCDAAGRPVAIRCNIINGGRAVFLRPRSNSPIPSPATLSASRP